MFAYRLAERLSWAGDPMRLLDALPRHVVRTWWAVAVLDNWMQFDDTKDQTPEQMMALLSGRFR